MNRHEQAAKIIRHYEKGMIEFSDMITDIDVINLTNPCADNCPECK